MPVVAASGARTFRIPQGAISDTLVEKAAQNGVTVLAQLGGGSALPEDRTAYRNGVAALVARYGINGGFWSESKHAGLPYKPITTWEVWNEENDRGIPAAKFGEFVSEIANAVHSASLGGNPEVLSGGLLMTGNSPHGETGVDTYLGAIAYLERAYPYFAGNANVAGVAVHPYELDPESFHEPGYTAAQAFEYAVSGFRAKLNSLATASKTSKKQLSITEFGWPGAGGQWNVGEEQQAVLLGAVVNYARVKEGTLQLTNLDWYSFRDADEEQNEWARNCGLRASNGHFRSAWTQYQAAAGVQQFIPQTPAVETGTASGVLERSAALGGVVGPNGLPTRYHFEYGTTTSYGKSAPSPEGTIGSGSAPTSVSTAVGNLEPETAYHYRLVASNAIGTSYGGDRVLTTADRAPLVAFQANNGDLDTYNSASGIKDLGMGMKTATSPSIATNSAGQYVIAFQSNAGSLFVYSSTQGVKNIGLGVKAETSPATIMRSDSRYVLVFQGRSGELNVLPSTLPTVTFLGGMKTATSPSIATNSAGQYVIAFQTNTGELFTYTPTQGTRDVGGMAAGTSPSVAWLPEGNYTVAFQANNGDLDTYNSASGIKDLGMGMKTATSPSIATNSAGQYVIAFQTNTGELFTYTPTQGTRDVGGMAAGTSPSVAWLPEGNYTVAFQANNGDLDTYNSASGIKDLGMGMKTATSPSIATNSAGQYVIAFQTNTGELFTYTPTQGTRDVGGMAAGTSPSVAWLPEGNYTVAFQANNGDLDTYNSASGIKDADVWLKSGASAAIAGAAGGFLVASTSNSGEALVYWSETGLRASV